MKGEIEYLTGRSLNQYSIIEFIGRGGASRVFRAYDPDRKQEVALKVLKLHAAQDESTFRRFQREVQLLMQLNHPHIVPVYDFGEDEGFPYLVMPYYAGGSLSDRIANGQIPVDDMLSIVAQIVSALDYAHQQGVIHRDVKADNILFDDDGNALLSDFGLARLADTTISITGSHIIGTPAYISPEQARGLDVSPSTDQYSLGIVLFQLLTGQLPYNADTPLAVLMKHVQEPIPIPSQSNPEIPDIIDRVVLKSTAKQPTKRFTSITEMNDTLRAGYAYARNPKTHKPPTIDLPVSMQATKAYVMPFLREKRGQLRLTLFGLFVLAAVITIIVIPGSSSWLVRSFQDLLQPISAVGSIPDALNTEIPAEHYQPTQYPLEPNQPTQAMDHPICALLFLNEFSIEEDEIQWTIRNESDRSVVLYKVQLSWPTENGNMRAIQLDETIWSVELPPPAAIIPEWEGEVDLRTISGGASGTISFTFTVGPRIGDYGLKVSFEDICTIEATD